MFDFLATVGPEIPFTLILLALLGFRHAIRPRASLRIAAPADKVFAIIDVHDGKTDDWGSTIVRADLVDPVNQVFRKSYITTLSTGTQRVSQAFFRLAERVAGNRVVLLREGLAGKSVNSELLEQRYEVTPEGDTASRLTVEYVWGPRPLLAQITARADIWGGIYRLKGVAETGVPNEKPYRWISAGVAVATGIVSLAAFGFLLGWIAAAVLVFALFVHEFGHLFAYKLMGQPWGRMVFLPFLGAIALPRLPFESQGQAVFAALMGPGLSTLLAMACVAPATFGLEPNPYVAIVGVITVGLNIFNLLPVEPLDGGVALRSVLSRIMGSHARFGLIMVGVAIMVTGVMMEQVVLLIFGGIAVLANIKARAIDAGLTPLSRLQIVITGFAYVAMTSAYVTLFKYFYAYVHLLQTAA